MDFGYPWWLTYGHLVIFAPAFAALAFGWRNQWGKWKMLLLGALTLWSFSAHLAARSMGMNERGTLPTENFFRSGQGRVLDIGAGTGRSSIALLEARPRATLVALDLFGNSFDHHFGHGEKPQDRLLANLKAAGVAERASIETADMRKLPFEAASFDAILSAYAVDHLPRDGVKQALAEAARVVKPGGEFLLMLVHNHGWARFAWGPLISHGGFRGTGWWTDRAREAGFEVAEQGMAPATMYFVLRRP